MKHFFSISIVFFILPGFLLAQSPGHLTGEFESVRKDSSKVYLVSPSGSQIQAIVKNNQFDFNIPPDDTWETYFLHLGEARGGDASSYILPVLLNGSSEMNLKLDKNFYKFCLSGDVLSEEQNQFYQKLFDINEGRTEIESEINRISDSTAKAGLQEKLDWMALSVDSFQRVWVINHPASPFSLLIIRLFILKPHDQRSVNEVSQLLYAMPEDVKGESNDFRLLKSQLFGETKSDEFLRIKKGSQASDFHIKDTSGNIIALDEFEGKYLLIDFWASWCGPCKASIPVLHSIYNKYHSKGLQMLSISMDTNPGEWKKGIDDGNMVWRQGSDLKGYFAKGNSIQGTYDIFSVPQFLLISKDRKVLFRYFGFGRPTEERITHELDKIFADKKL